MQKMGEVEHLLLFRFAQTAGQLQHEITHRYAFSGGSTHQKYRTARGYGCAAVVGRKACSFWANSASVVAMSS
jgi:hypothetical protein